MASKRYPGVINQNACSHWAALNYSCESSPEKLRKHTGIEENDSDSGKGLKTRDATCSGLFENIRKLFTVYMPVGPMIHLFAFSIVRKIVKYASSLASYRD